MAGDGPAKPKQPWENFSLGSSGLWTLTKEDPMYVAGTKPEPELIWGALAATSTERLETRFPDNDKRPKLDGTPQLSQSYYRLMLKEGEERTELGNNNWRQAGEYGKEGTMITNWALVRRIIAWSSRLSANFPTNVLNFNTIVQQKQCQPYTNDGHTQPIMEIEVISNNIILVIEGHNEENPAYKIPVAPAQEGWCRFAWDTTYSPLPTIGKTRLIADMRPNATTFAPNYDSGTFEVPTLTAAIGEQSGFNWKFNDGDPIPSHLRIGQYRSAAIHPGATTYHDISNFQVYSQYVPILRSY